MHTPGQQGLPHGSRATKLLTDLAAVDPKPAAELLPQGPMSRGLWQLIPAPSAKTALNLSFPKIRKGFHTSMQERRC